MNHIDSNSNEVNEKSSSPRLSTDSTKKVRKTVKIPRETNSKTKKMFNQLKNLFADVC